MNLYNKLDVLVKKAEELDELGNELSKVDGSKNPIQERCISQAALQLADELESMTYLFTDDDIDEINAALSDEELAELHELIDESEE